MTTIDEFLPHFSKNDVPVLPKGYRRIVILHDVCGYEREEIASMLNCASGAS